MIFHCFNVKMLIVLGQFAPATPNLFPDDGLVSPKNSTTNKKEDRPKQGLSFQNCSQHFLCISSGFKYQFSENLNKNKILSNKFWAQGQQLFLLNTQNRFVCTITKLSLYYTKNGKALNTCQQCGRGVDSVNRGSRLLSP